MIVALNNAVRCSTWMGIFICTVNYWIWTGNISFQIIFERAKFSLIEFIASNSNFKVG